MPKRTETECTQIECTETICSSKQKLVDDLKIVIADAEEILRTTAGLAGEKVVELRGQIKERLEDAKIRLVDVENALIGKTRAAAQATDVYVKENPWQAVGIAAGIGLLIGIFSSRR